ncbi:MAG: DDE-type integrase/transposase/recombinase, partial [Limnohabitans sp.]|nr:DDE-type integrase/transposase/recombinase [Limnohabitans sp.]
ENDILYFIDKNDILVMVPDKMKKGLIFMYHDHPTAGHLGIESTYKRMRTKYFWKGMRKDIENYVASCLTCLQKKTPKHAKYGLIEPISVNAPFGKIGIDIVGPLSKAHGKEYIIVATDYFTKWAETRALSAATAANTAKFITEQIFCRHGTPACMVSDRGTNFLSKVVENCLECMGTKHLRTTSYHPQTNGLTEKVNGLLCEMLAMYVNSKHSDWDTLLPFVTFAYNTSPRSSTKFSPFYILYGRNPVLPYDLLNGVKITEYKNLEEYKNLINTKWPELRDLVKNNILQAQNKYREQGNKKRKEHAFFKGQKVMVYNPAKKVGLTDKFLLKWHGPFTLLKQTSNNNFLVDFGKKQDIVHVEKLKPFRERTESSSLSESDESTTFEFDSKVTNKAVTAKINETSSEEEVIQRPKFERKPRGRPRKLLQVKDTSTNRESDQSSTVNVKRSTRINKGIPPKRFTFGSLVMLAFCLTLSESVFHGTSSVQWKNTHTKVIKGKELVTLSFKYYLPCEYFKNSNEEQKWCDELIAKNFYKPLNDFCPTEIEKQHHHLRVKRVIPIIAAVGIAILAIGIIGVSTFAAVVATSSSKNINKLQNKFDFFEEKYEKLLGKTLLIEKTLENLIKDFNQLKSDLPKYVISIASIASRMEIVKYSLNNIKRNWKNGKIHEDMFTFMNITLPCIGLDCSVSFMEPVSCKHNNQLNEIEIKFQLVLFEEKIQILKADPFVIFKEKNHEICDFNYKGPQYISKNEENNKICAVNTHDSELENLIYLDDNNCVNDSFKGIQVWKPGKCYNKRMLLLTEVVQVKSSKEWNIIFCHPFNIVYYNTNISCPDFPFLLPFNTSFRVNGVKYTFTSKNYKSETHLSDYSLHFINTKLFPGMDTSKINPIEKENVIDYHLIITITIIIVLCVFMITAITVLIIRKFKLISNRKKVIEHIELKETNFKELEQHIISQTDPKVFNVVMSD